MFNKLFSNFFIYSFFVIYVVSGVTARAADRIDRDQFDGIYKGKMEFYDGTPEMPLDLSLVLTEEYVVVPKGGGVFEEQQVIDGAFSVDGEGGPFSFWRVTYNIDRSVIDMRYNRPNQTIGVQIPPGFRLIGKMQDGGVIKGKVISGMKGPIGTFEVKHSDDKMLKHTVKYWGTWSGTAQFVSGPIPLQIQVGVSNLVMINPPDMEFDFTDGKTGHVMVRGIKLQINKILVDYLRRRMFLIDTASDSSGQNSAVTYELQFGKSLDVLTGKIHSRYRGMTATFKLYRHPQ